MRDFGVRQPGFFDNVELNGRDDEAAALGEAQKVLIVFGRDQQLATVTCPDGSLPAASMSAAPTPILASQALMLTIS